MTKYLLRITLGAAVLAAGSGSASADSLITVTFNNPAAGSSVMATCEAAVTPAVDKKKPARRNETVVWVLKKGDCSVFDPASVSLVFATDLFPSRTLSGTSNGIKYKTTRNKSKAKDKSVHPYFILYDGIFAGDPEIDVNGDCCPAP
jgi:hypothetical protein